MLLFCISILRLVHCFIFRFHHPSVKAIVEQTIWFVLQILINRSIYSLSFDFLSSIVLGVLCDRHPFIYAISNTIQLLTPSHPLSIHVWCISLCGFFMFYMYIFVIFLLDSLWWQLSQTCQKHQNFITA